MTHAECKDLLLDLIYGELLPERAAEVELHLVGCTECRVERDSLTGTRGAFAPLISGLEAGERAPGPNFDLPILAAAREAAAEMARAKAPSAAPLAAVISLAEVRASARVPDAQRVRHKPRWMRATLIGSIAAAAALALVVSTSNTKANKVILGVPAQSAEEMRPAEPKGAQAHEDTAIKARPVTAEGESSAVQGVAQPLPAGAPPQVLPEPSMGTDGLRGVAGVSPATGRGGAGLGLLGPSGPSRNEDRKAVAAKPAAPKVEFAPPPQNWIGDRAEKKKSNHAVSLGRLDALDDDNSAPASGTVGGLSRGAAGEGSAGSLVKDSAPAPGAAARKMAAPQPTDDKPAEREAFKREESKADAQAEAARANAPPPAMPAPEAPPSAPRAPPPPPAPVAVMSPPPPAGAMHAAPRAMQLPSSGKSASSAAEREEPPSLEARASSARATGQLHQAGRIYREAADAQFALSTPDGHARGANDLANAVACYAQAGDLSEARKLRDRLVSLAPDEPSAIARANGEIEARLPRRPAAADVPASTGR